MKFLTKEQWESYESAKICYICQDRFGNKYLKDIKFCKVKNHFIIQESIEVLRIAYVI